MGKHVQLAVPTYQPPKSINHFSNLDQKCCGISNAQVLLWHIIRIDNPAKIWMILTLSTKLVEQWDSVQNHSKIVYTSYILFMFLGTLWNTNYWATQRQIKHFFDPNPMQHTLNHIWCGSATCILFFASIYYMAYGIFFGLIANNHPIDFVLAGWNSFIALLFLFTIVLNQGKVEVNFDPTELEQFTSKYKDSVNYKDNPKYKDQPDYKDQPKEPKTHCI